MKKFILFMGCLTLLVAGCNKEQNIEDLTPETPRHLKFDISVNYGDDTRAVKTEWESGDKIYVAFDHFFTNEAQTTVYYMTMTYGDGNWDCSFSNSALEEYLLEQSGGKLTALYLPFGNPRFTYSSGSNGEIRFNLSRPDSPTTEVKSSYYSSCSNIAYSVTDGVLSATLNMRIQYFVQFFIEGVPESEVANYELVNDQIAMCRAAYCTYVGGVNYPSWNSIVGNHGSAIDGFYYKNGILFSGSLNPDVRGVPRTYSIKVVDNRGTAASSDDLTYTLTKEATLNDLSSVKLPALNSGKWTISGKNYIDGHEYVDMGAAGWWATMNVGAESETVPGEFLSWSEGNAAAENWGGEWRLPTKEEWESLIGYCTWEWDDSKGGMIVTSNSNGKSLFLPGERDYWSSNNNNGSYYYLKLESGGKPGLVESSSSDLPISVRFFNGNSHAETFNPEEEG